MIELIKGIILRHIEQTKASLSNISTKMEGVANE